MKKNRIKVLLSGQLPVEVGGNYTTGIAKVVYELSRQKAENLEFFVYATNAKAGHISISNSPSKYFGYRFLIGKMFKNMILHPCRTIKEWKAYRQGEKVNPLRFEFYKANYELLLEAIKPDIIHVNGSGIEPLFFANKGRVPILLTCHGVFERFRNPNSSANLYADFVTGLTDETKEEIHDYFCVDKKKVTIIPNGVDTSKFYYSKLDRTAIRTAMGVKETTTVFITVASVQERKGQLRFTQLLYNLPFKDWEYWIIGKGPTEGNIKEYAESRGIANKVKLLGYKNGDELYKYYSAADIYAHASTMEGQALCEIEAFATGLKILVNNRLKGTIANEELENGDYLFVDFDQPDHEKIDQWAHRFMSERHTIKTMDWSVVVRKYADLYKSILEQQKA